MPENSLPPISSSSTLANTSTTATDSANTVILLPEQSNAQPLEPLTGSLKAPGVSSGYYMTVGDGPAMAEAGELPGVLKRFSYRLTQEDAAFFSDAVPGGNIGDSNEISKRLWATFKCLDEQHVNVSESINDPGSTGTVVLLVEGRLYIANVGDSPTFLALYNEKGECIEVIRPNKALHDWKNPEEVQRFKRLSQEKKTGSCELQYDRLDGRLAVSRAFGDKVEGWVHLAKQREALQAILPAHATIDVIDLSQWPNTSIRVITASDGLIEHCPDLEPDVPETQRNAMEKKNQEQFLMTCLQDPRCQTAAQEGEAALAKALGEVSSEVISLSGKCVSRARDNKTIIVTHLNTSYLSEIQSACWGVFDGHGGPEVSTAVATKFMSVLTNFLTMEKGEFFNHQYSPDNPVLAPFYQQDNPLFVDSTDLLPPISSAPVTQTETSSTDDFATWQALFAAAEREDFSLINELLNLCPHKDYLNLANNSGYTLLHLVAWISDELGLNDRIGLVKKLVALGADINAQNSSDGSTPLHRVAEEGHLKMMKTLIEFKEAGINVNINAKDKGDNTPLHCVFGYYGREHEKRIIRLLKHGADVNAQNLQGQTPLHLAVEQKNYEAIALLIRHGARSDLKDNQGKEPLESLAYQDRIEVACRIAEVVEASNESVVLKIETQALSQAFMGFLGTSRCKFSPKDVANYDKYVTLSINPAELEKIKDANLRDILKQTIGVQPAVSDSSNAASVNSGSASNSALSLEPWKTETESDVELKNLTGEYEEYTFNLPEPAGEESRYFASPKSWAQAFLPGVYIGGAAAILGHYDVHQYPKYDVIFDMSAMPIATKLNVDIKLSDGHDKKDIEDMGTVDNFNKLKDYFEQTVLPKLNAARLEGKTVLINCREGQSRSATVVMMLLMKQYGLTAVEAYHYLRAYRPIVLPNAGFFSQLLAYEKELGCVLREATKQLSANWIKEYQQNNFEQFYNDKVMYDGSNVRIPTKVHEINDDYVKLNIESSQFIKFISFLTIEGHEYKIENADKFNAEVAIRHELFLTLAGAPTIEAWLSEEAKDGGFDRTQMLDQRSAASAASSSGPSTEASSLKPQNTELEDIAIWNKLFKKLEESTLFDSDWQEIKSLLLQVSNKDYLSLPALENHQRHTLLHYLVTHQHPVALEVVDQLKKRYDELNQNPDEKFDIDPKDVSQSTPLHWVIINSPMFIEMIRKLLELGANTNAQDNDGRTPMHIFFDSGCADDRIKAPIDIMLQYGADINMADNNNQTVLHHAAAQGGIETIAFLISRGADLSQKDKGNALPLDALSDSKLEELWGFIDNSQDENVVTAKSKLRDYMKYRQSKSPATLLSEDFSVYTLQSVDQNDVTIQLAFHHAQALTKKLQQLQVEIRRPRVVANKTESSMDKATVRERLDFQPRSYATHSSLILSHEDFFRFGGLARMSEWLSAAVEKQDFNKVNELLKLSSSQTILKDGIEVNVNIKDSDGNTPLHLAAMSADEKMMELLIKHGARLLLKNELDKMPLDCLSDEALFNFVGRYSDDTLPSQLAAYSSYRYRETDLPATLQEILDSQQENEDKSDGLLSSHLSSSSSTPLTSSSSSGAASSGASSSSSMPLETQTYQALHEQKHYVGFITKLIGELNAKVAANPKGVDGLSTGQKQMYQYLLLLQSAQLKTGSKRLETAWIAQASEIMQNVCHRVCEIAKNRLKSSTFSFFREEDTETFYQQFQFATSAAAGIKPDNAAPSSGASSSQPRARAQASSVSSDLYRPSPVLPKREDKDSEKSCSYQ